MLVEYGIKRRNCKKEAYKTLCKNLSENLAKYKALKSKAKKMVTSAMNEEVEKQIENLGRNPNNIFNFVKSMQKIVKMLKGVDA